jgi:integrase
MARNGHKPPEKRPVVVRNMPDRVWENVDGSEGRAFRFRYPNPQKPGKYIILQFQTKAERERERIKIEGELAQNIHIPLGDNPTLAEWAWQYYDDKKKAGLATGSLYQIERTLRMHILGGWRGTPPGECLYLGRYKLAELKPSIVKDWTRAIHGEPPPEHLTKPHGRTGYRQRPMPRSIVIVSDAHELLKEMLQAALDQEVPGVTRNVAAKVKVEDAKAKRESDEVEEGVDFMTIEEMKQILRYARDKMPRCEPRWYPMIATYIFTGGRTGEIQALDWNRDIHFDTGWIDIRFAFNKYHRTPGRTKTKAGRRQVPLFEPLISILKDWMLECPSEGPRLPGVEGKVRQVAQFLKLNPSVPNIKVEQLFHLSHHCVIAIREELGLPRRVRGGRRRADVNPPALIMPAEDDEVSLPASWESRRLGLVFPSRDGRNRNVLSVVIERRIRDIQRAIGLIERDAQGDPILAADGKPKWKYSPHSFRHFYVSYCAHLGFTLDEVARFVGHTSAAMTKHYRHFFRDAEKEARDRAKLSAGFRLLLSSPSNEETGTKIIDFRTKENKALKR